MDAYREHLGREFVYQRDRLIAETRLLGEQLVRIADRIEAGDHIVNALGEVQGQGPALDVRCASYVAARNTLQNYDAFADMAKQEA